MTREEAFSMLDRMAKGIAEMFDSLVADIFDAYYAMKDGSLTLDETGAGETADTTADGQDAVPETVENNDALAGDTAPAEQPAV